MYSSIGALYMYNEKNILKFYHVENMTINNKWKVILKSKRWFLSVSDIMSLSTETYSY